MNLYAAEWGEMGDREERGEASERKERNMTRPRFQANGLRLVVSDG